MPVRVRRLISFLLSAAVTRHNESLPSGIESENVRRASSMKRECPLFVTRLRNNRLTLHVVQICARIATIRHINYGRSVRNAFPSPSPSDFPSVVSSLFNFIVTKVRLRFLLGFNVGVFSCQKEQMISDSVSTSRVLI